MNAYEVKVGMVFFTGQKLCDPCLSALRWFVYQARRYTSALIYILAYAMPYICTSCNLAFNFHARCFHLYRSCFVILSSAFLAYATAENKGA